MSEKMGRLFFLVIVWLLFSDMLWADIAPETPRNSLSLPAEYPDSWLFASNSAYFSSVMGEYMLLDVAAPFKQFKGTLQGSLRASFAESQTRSELYVAETHFSRGTQGERLDTLTIYEKQNLSPIAEIILPKNKRAIMVGHRGMLQLTRDEKFVLIYNFTPGTSVTVVDMDKRQVVGEVLMPGCSLIYPSGQRGFSSLCANGAMVSFTLDAEGQVVDQNLSEAFNDIDNNVLYMQPGFIEGIAYFPTAGGQVQPVDLNPKRAVILPPWPLVSQEQAANAWRTADGQTVAADFAGRLYVRVHQVKGDGSHRPDTSEVWVFDVQKQQRIARIPLKSDGGAIAVTRGKTPWLAVSGKEGIDVYNALQGDYVRTIGGWKATVELLIPSL